MHCDFALNGPIFPSISPFIIYKKKPDFTSAYLIFKLWGRGGENMKFTAAT